MSNSKSLFCKVLRQPLIASSRAAFEQIHRTWQSKVTVLLAALLLVGAFNFFGAFARPAQVVLDIWHQYAGQRYEPSHVVLAVIDEKTLTYLEAEPIAFWMPHVAKAISIAHQNGAELVGLDLLFSTSAADWLRRHGIQSDVGEALDRELRKEIGTGRVVQVGALVPTGTGQDAFLLPHLDYLLSIPDLDIASHLALSNLDPDTDGVIRSFRRVREFEGQPETPREMLPSHTFGALLASRRSSHAKGDSRIGERTPTSSSPPSRIAFSGPPGTIPRISLRDLIVANGESPELRKVLAGKIVIVGAEYIAMGDRHPTPYSSSLLGQAPQMMTGPEIQANIVETILGNRQVTEVPPWADLTVALALAVTASLMIEQFGLLIGAFACLMLSIAALGLSYIAFLNNYLLSAIVGPVSLGLVFIGTAATRFGHESRERRRIQQVFGRYVSDNVVEMLLSTGSDMRLGGEKREVTILFSDIRGFTTISERLDPQEVVALLNSYFEGVCEIALQHGGTIDKFIGDAIMVQFGAPVAFPDHADRALRVAVAIRHHAESFQEQVCERFAARGLPPFRVGIGVHTGEVVVGNLGSTKRTEYTIVGDAVNVASRIEGMTKNLSCTILASGETVRKCKSKFQTRFVENAILRGRTTSVDLFEVLDHDEVLEHELELGRR